MTIESEIGTPIDGGEDFDYRDGFVMADCADADLIVLRFMVDGDQIASASLDRFKAGMLVGLLQQVAHEAVSA